MPPDVETNRLFIALCDLKPSERRSFLDANVPDAEKRARLERLLEHFDRGTMHVDIGDVVGAGLSEDKPRRIGPYVVRDELGSGGMGVVYLAEQAHPKRLVAVKVLRHVGLTRELARRFELEAELLGRLQHPGIAQILEAGAEGEGVHSRGYLVMEYIDGRPITEYAVEEDLDIRARLRLVVKVADAVHHAHARGVIHRDLKPSNILTTTEGQTKVIDFGVARVTDREDACTQQTAAGQLVGTLAYMSPEQVKGELDAIDSRADVYALGVLTYELLSGSLPIDLTSRSIAASVRLVCDAEPRRLGLVCPECRGDVEWIVARAIEKDPARRYQSAAAFAADIRRHLAHEPIDARPTSAIYQLGKIARRHRGLVAGAIIALLAILGGAAVAVHYGLKNIRLAKLESDARRTAETNAAEARRLADVAEKRAEDVQAVSQFVSRQMQAISSWDIGKLIRGAIEKEVRDGLGRSGAGEEQVAAKLDELRSLLEPVNTTSVANITLAGGFFVPMREAIDRQFADRPTLHVKLLTEHGLLLARQSQTEAAEQVLRAAVDCAGTLDPRAPEVLLARLALGGHMNQMGRLDDAERLISETRELARGVLADDHTEMLNALSHLARIAAARGDRETAEARFREELRLRRIAAASGDPTELLSLVTTLNNLGVFLQRSKRLEEAYELSLEASALANPDEPTDIMTVIIALAFRASSLLALGRLEESLPVWEQTLEHTRQQFGEDHYRTLNTKQSIVVALMSMGEFERSEPFQRAVLEFREREHGTDHLLTIESRVQLAYTLMSIHRLDEAGQLARSTLTSLDDILGRTHVRTLYSARLLEKIYRTRIEQGEGTEELNHAIDEIVERYSPSDS